MKSSSSFAEQLERIRLVTDTQTRLALASVLGIRQSSIAEAERCDSLPFRWLGTLMRTHNVNPEWVLTGEGQPRLDAEALARLKRDVYAEQELLDESMLRRFPARMLVEELLRRVTVAEEESSGCLGGVSK